MVALGWITHCWSAEKILTLYSPFKLINTSSGFSSEIEFKGRVNQSSATYPFILKLRMLFELSIRGSGVDVFEV